VCEALSLIDRGWAKSVLVRLRFEAPLNPLQSAGPRL